MGVGAEVKVAVGVMQTAPCLSILSPAHAAPAERDTMTSRRVGTELPGFRGYSMRIS